MLFRSRIYLPQQDLARFGVKVEDLQSATPAPPFLELMRFEASRARNYYRESRPLLEMVHRKSRRSLWALIEIYSRLLDRIERSNYDVFTRRIRLSTAQKSWIVARAASRAVL